ncbi:MAG TPA: helix-turn-helix transcriptional regulator [Terriglobales bacterium]|nr:helix-turn-helix transcriptional regulator [Terriglobales bacterium]
MLGSPRSGRGRHKGIAVRPEAIREARLEKGLSLAEVAGDDVTRAAIHLVETGKMRPSMRTLELIAQRTGRPVSYFMQAHGSEAQKAACEELSRLVDTGNYHEAVQLGNRLLGEGLEAAVEAEVRFGLGRALVRMVDGTAALEHLPRARQLFERLGDSWMVARVLEQQANAMFLAGDPRALGCALEALERCERLEPADPTLRATVLNHIGSIHMRSRDWHNAARFFEMGLAVREELVSLRLRARLHDGLTAAYQYLGDFKGARRSAERAYALYTVDADVSGLIRAENNLGYVLLQQDELEAAAPHLHRALDLCEERDAAPLLRAYTLNSLGELHIALGEPDVARAYLLRSLGVARGLGERGTEATARHLLGTASVELGYEDAADEWFRSAIELLSQLDLVERLRSCAAEYAELLYRRRRLDESVTYWRVAAGAANRTARPAAVDESRMDGASA